MAALPKAWNQLVNEPDDLLVELVAEKVKELCKHKPDEDEVEQFLSTHLQNIKITQPPMGRKPDPPPKPKPSGSMKGKKPTAFTFNGTSYKVTSWSRMLVRTCEVVHSEQRSRFEEVLSFKRGRTPDFSREQSDFKHPRPAREINKTGIFVNTCKNADQIIQTAKNLIAHFGYDENALHIDAQ